MVDGCFVARMNIILSQNYTQRPGRQAAEFGRHRAQSSDLLAGWRLQMVHDTMRATANGVQRLRRISEHARTQHAAID